MLLLRFLPLLLLVLGFSACAQHVLNSRAQNNLQQWDNSTVYDPVTQRSYHTQAPTPMGEAQRRSDVLEETQND